MSIPLDYTETMICNGGELEVINEIPMSVKKEYKSVIKEKDSFQSNFHSKKFNHRKTERSFFQIDDDNDSERRSFDNFNRIDNINNIDNNDNDPNDLINDNAINIIRMMGKLP